MPCSLSSRTKITDTTSVTEHQISGSHLWRQQTEHVAFLGLRWLTQQEKWHLIASKPHTAVHLQWRHEQGFLSSSGLLYQPGGPETGWPNCRVAQCPISQQMEWSTCCSQGTAGCRALLVWLQLNVLLLLGAKGSLPAVNPWRVFKSVALNL